MFFSKIYVTLHRFAPHLRSRPLHLLFAPSKSKKLASLQDPNSFPQRMGFQTAL